MTNQNAFLGIPIPFKDICKVYPPKVKDVVENPDLLAMYSILTMTQEDIEDKQKDKKEKAPTPLELLLINCYHDKDFENLVKRTFTLFTKSEITLLIDLKMICFISSKQMAELSDIQSLKYLNEENFFDFQNALRMAMGSKIVVPPDPNEDAITKRVKAAARRRERIVSKKKSGPSFGTTLCAICCMGIGITPLNVGEISYASVSNLISMYQQKEKYQTDIDSLMAGADPKKVKPKYWIREESDLEEIKI